MQIGKKQNDLSCTVVCSTHTTAQKTGWSAPSTRLTKRVLRQT